MKCCIVRRAYLNHAIAVVFCLALNHFPCPTPTPQILGYNISPKCPTCPPPEGRVPETYFYWKLPFCVGANVVEQRSHFPVAGPSAIVTAWVLVTQWPKLSSSVGLMHHHHKLCKIEKNLLGNVFPSDSAPPLGGR